MPTASPGSRPTPPPPSPENRAFLEKGIIEPAEWLISRAQRLVCSSSSVASNFGVRIESGKSLTQPARPLLLPLGAFSVLLERLWPIVRPASVTPTDPGHSPHVQLLHCLLVTLSLPIRISIEPNPFKLRQLGSNPCPSHPSTSPDTQIAVLHRKHQPHTQPRKPPSPPDQLPAPHASIPQFIIFN
jgi:hypothetical protein